jgi:transcriptional regulator with XRE-family HTH domain
VQLTFNSDALRRAAVAAGDVGAGGQLNYSRIARRANVDTATVSRVHRRISAPDLRTAFRLAWAYGLTIEDLIEVCAEQSVLAA